MTSRLAVFFLLLSGLVIPSSNVRGDVILTIDPSNPSAVLFSATGNSASVTDGPTDIGVGVTLLDILAADFSLNGPPPALLPTTLTPAGAMDPFNSVENEFFSIGSRDINVYASGSLSVMQFDSALPAFTGSATADLTGAIFASPGTTGDIIVGDTDAGSGAIIGQYQVVPEPSCLIGLAIGSCVLLRRRRQAAS